MIIRAFIQARMNSSRFPGKVLAPLAGRPIIAHVVERIAQVIPRDQMVVATSSECSDDPLGSYVDKLGIPVFRGPLDDVFARFRLCLAEYPCDWFLRVSADSPLIDHSIIVAMLPYASAGNFDLVTNVQKRTFPHGHSVEMIRADTFMAIDATRLSTNDREHVTKFYYENPTEFSILNFENTDPAYGALNFAVDTIEDLRRLEQFLRSGNSYCGPRIVASGYTV